MYPRMHARILPGRDQSILPQNPALTHGEELQCLCCLEMVAMPRWRRGVIKHTQLEAHGG